MDPEDHTVWSEGQENQGWVGEATKWLFILRRQSPSCQAGASDSPCDFHRASPERQNSQVKAVSGCSRQTKNPPGHMNCLTPSTCSTSLHGAVWAADRVGWVRKKGKQCPSCPPPLSAPAGLGKRPNTSRPGIQFSSCKRLPDVQVEVRVCKSHGTCSSPPEAGKAVSCLSDMLITVLGMSIRGPCGEGPERHGWGWAPNSWLRRCPAEKRSTETLLGKKCCQLRRRG